MISKIEKLLYNRYFCYFPIAFMAIAITFLLMRLSPLKCLIAITAEECIARSNTLYMVYHPINLVILLFAIYNLLCLYYNINLKVNMVGKSVRKIYRNTMKKYYVQNFYKKITILLFCYTTALIISYFRFPVVLKKTL